MPGLPSREVHVQEETGDEQTQGCYASETITWSANPGETYKDVVLPMPVGLLSAYILLSGLNLNDKVAVDIAPDTPLGTLPSGVDAGSVVIPMPASMKAAWQAGQLRLGARINLDDGTNNDELGLLLGVDEDADTFEVRNQTTNSFGAGAVVLYTVSMSPCVLQDGHKGWAHLRAGHGEVQTFGMAKIGSSYVPAGKVIRCRFHNSGLVAVNPVIGFEFLY